MGGSGSWVRQTSFLKSGGRDGCGSTRQVFPSLVDPSPDPYNLILLLVDHGVFVHQPLVQ